MNNENVDQPTRNAGLQVLVVEDESVVVMLIEDMLTDLGHYVVATSGSMSNASKLVSDTTRTSRFSTSN
jgi:CheY-like chemotaxis protein